MKKTFLILLLLLISLSTALVLVKSNQDSRRQAANAQISALFYPEQLTVQTGQRFSQVFILDTHEYRLNAVDTRIKFDPRLFKVISVTPLSKQSNQYPGSKYLFQNDIDALDLRFDNQLGTINVLGVNLAEESAVETGIINLVRIDFEALSSGPVELALDPSYRHLVTGYNSTLAPTAVPTLPLYSSPTPTPTGSPTSSVLKFKFSFAGVSPYADCSSWPISVLVRSDIGTTKLFTEINPIRIDSDSSYLAVYSATLNLTGFTDHQNLSVFIKGPRHLQTKYGLNGQDSYYNLPVGQISVTSDPNTTPVYDFTNYPLPAGDITGPHSLSDGVVNGLDFAQVKNQAVSRLQGSGNNSFPGDLDGNCQVNSVDITTLMQTLREQLDQVY
jgi:hypothetical protein